MGNRQTIGIDCRLSGDRHAGIGRYVEELVRFVTQDNSIDWVLFFHEPHQLPWLEEKSNVKVVIAPIRHYTIAEQLHMPAIFSKEKLDLLHIPHFNIPLLYSGPMVVTIHDLLWHEQQGAHVTTLSPLTYALKYQAYKYVASKAITKATALIVPSQTVKDTLVRLEQADPNKINVTYEGVDEKWFKEGSQPKVERETKQKKLFYTGSLYPHKNVMLIVQALRKLPEYTLHISSSRNIFVDEFLKQVEKLQMKDRVIHLGRLSDEQLRQQYKTATAFVQPSLSEGFGLPALEAMAAGLPVLASDIPIFNEIYKDSFIPFDPHSAESFLSAVHTLETGNTNILTTKATSLAKEYSWKKMGEQSLTIYKHILATVPSL